MRDMRLRRILDKSHKPGCQSIQHFRCHVRILASSPCGHMKRVVRMLKQLEGCPRVKPLHQCLYQSGVGERVTGSLQKQHWDFDLEQMSSTFVRGASGGMQREAE